MKNIIIGLAAICYSHNVVAQISVKQDTSCGFLKNLNFTNGIDTVEIKATFQDLVESSDYSILKILDREKKIHYNDYGVDTGKMGNNHSINFRPINCQESFEGTVSRKIFRRDANVKTRDIGDYSNAILVIGDLKIGQVIYLKCLVFEDKRFKDDLGTYFFTIVDIDVVK